jgi:hypothetical protein
VVSLVTKVRDTAGGLYQQAKAKYASSDAMQKAGQQAGQVRQKAGKQAGQMAGQAREIAGKQAGVLASKLKEYADRATTAAKDARAKGTAHR